MNAKEIHQRLKNINFDLDLIDTVIYHNNCPDGFSSAWIIWRYLKNDATYKGITPDNLPPYTQFKNKYVIFVDLSTPYEYIEKVKSVAKNLLVIDHHETYASQIEHHSNVIFDREHSAIYITWRTFNPDEKIPQFVRYIEDNDLATYQIKNTEAFVSALGTKLPFHHIDFFKLWDKLMNPAFVDSLLSDGAKYNEFKNYILKRNLHIAEPMKLGGYKVLVANFGAVGLASDLGNKLSEQNPQYNFVILWSYHSANKEYSIMLRTRHDNIDLSKLAKLYNGGGHPRASRFAWKNDITDLWKELNTKLSDKELKNTFKISRKTLKNTTKSFNMKSKNFKKSKKEIKSIRNTDEL